MRDNVAPGSSSIMLTARAIESGLGQVTLLAAGSQGSADGALKTPVETVPYDALVYGRLALVTTRAPA